MTSLAVMQPGYMPWLGLFDLIRRADHFVFYDDVQFDKHGWRNRNRIKSANGVAWLSVPVRHAGLGPQSIRQVRIDNSQPWRRKHLSALSQSYARAPFREPYLSELASLLNGDWELLADLDIALTGLIAGWLGLSAPSCRSSELPLEGDRNDRLIWLCKHFSASTYISANGAQTYLDTSLFEKNDIDVQWQNYRHPSYGQLHGKFEPYLSAVDMIFNHGPNSRCILEKEGYVEPGS